MKRSELTRISIRQAWEDGLITEGTMIRTNGASFPHHTSIGIVGEIYHTGDGDDQFYFWQNSKAGGSNKSPTGGYQFSWCINVDDPGWIEFVSKPIDHNIRTEDPVYIVFDNEFRTIGTAKDKRQLQTVLKSLKPPFRIFKVSEVKTKISLIDL